MTSATTATTMKQLDKILRQRRGVLNFKDYTVTEKHVKRMQELADTFPEVFDNPMSTPRSKWWDHPKYNMNPQMPNYHVHFRQEMQRVLSYLNKAHDEAAVANRDSGKKFSSKHHQYVKSALHMFQNSMAGLHGHVNIEERMLFPMFENRYHHIDFSFLYEDHKYLHETEAKLLQALRNSVGADSSSQSLEERLVTTIQLALEFDQQLMTHLGEEEEIILPMSLALEGRLH